jgi:uncharacterized protein (DUF2147 family)
MATIKSDDKVNTQNFRLEVVGLMGDVPNLVAVDFGQATVDLVESTEGDSKNREFNAAKVTYQDAVITMQKSKESPKWDKWYQECRTKKTPRDVTLTIKARDNKTDAYRCTIHKTWPKNVQAGNTSTDSGIPTVVVTLKVDRVTFA